MYLCLGPFTQLTGEISHVLGCAKAGTGFCGFNARMKIVFLYPRPPPPPVIIQNIYLRVGTRFGRAKTKVYKSEKRTQSEQFKSESLSPILVYPGYFRSVEQGLSKTHPQGVFFKPHQTSDKYQFNLKTTLIKRHLWSHISQ